MKKIFTIILLSALSLTAFAQKKSVAVLNPICGDNSVNNFYKQIVRGSMESAVTMTDEFVAFDRTAFDKVLEEHKFQQSGAVDDAQIRRMGVYAGVDLVLVTEVSAYDGYMSVLVKILNIETGESSRGLSELMEQTPPIVQSSCKELARKVFGIVDFACGIRKGTLSLPEGLYEGEIKNGKPHGNGKMYYKSDNENNRVSYEGEWENGVISGTGTMIWKNGGKYIGGWINGKKSGSATYTLPNKTVMEGTFQEGKANGPITLNLPNGDKYIGFAKNDSLMRGNGTYVYEDGRKYVGDFVWDAEEAWGSFSGYGVLYFADGKARYEGEFYEGKQHGKGTIYYSQGKVIGNWVSGILTGYVEAYYNDGSKEFGNFVDGQPDGEWRKRTSSGKYLIGRYSKGVMTTQYH